jgi:peptidoglycan DL-endopeptidase CwlO
VNRIELDLARRNYRAAEQRLALRLRQLYMSPSSDSTLEVILGASSLDQLISAVDTANRLSQEDRQIVSEVTRYRAEVTRRHARLGKARRAEARIVAERAAARARIAGGLAEQNRLLSSIRSDIVRLKREEAAQQARLAAEERARFLQEQLARQRQLGSLVVGATAVNPAGSNGFPSAVVVPPSQVGSRVVSIAMQYLGRPYVWGAAGPYSFDCSGLVTYVFAQVGISLPHFAASQWEYGTYVPVDQLQPGDLVFFENLGHVGIYVGGGEYIQAPQPGDVVKITPLSDPWSAANYYGAKRIVA